MAMSCSGCLLTYCFTACCNNITLSDNLQAKAIFHTGYNYAASCRMLPETVFRHYIFVSSDVDKFDFAVFLHMHIGALVVCILFVDSFILCLYWRIVILNNAQHVWIRHLKKQRNIEY